MKPTIKKVRDVKPGERYKRGERFYTLKEAIPLNCGHVAFYNHSEDSRAGAFQFYTSDDVEVLPPLEDGTRIQTPNNTIVWNGQWEEATSRALTWELLELAEVGATAFQLET